MALWGNGLARHSLEVKMIVRFYSGPPEGKIYVFSST